MSNPDRQMIKKSRNTNNLGRFVCDNCGRRFTEKANLQRHQVIHTPPKHQCKYDDCQFKHHNKNTVSLHESSHETTSLYCTVCYSRFGEQKNLNKHIKEQHSPPAFACSICQMLFKSKGNLQSHNNTYHQ